MPRRLDRIFRSALLPFKRQRRSAPGRSASAITWMPPRSKALDQPGIDQKAIETAGLGPTRAIVKQPFASVENTPLLGKGGIKPQTGGFLNDQRQVGRIEHIERRTHIHGLEVQSIDRIIGRVVKRI